VSAAYLSVGLTLVAAGELLRLWGVRHIGVISRTRSERLGPLVGSGPFALVRNPLYLGNVALWVGFTVSAGLLWLVPVVVVFLAVVYHAIVRWEETLLEGRRGDEYREYARRVLDGFRASRRRRQRPARSSRGAIPSSANAARSSAFSPAICSSI
jgi:protein-S-isoprenylcysteine O-methyltransferase Ste14